MRAMRNSREVTIFSLCRLFMRIKESEFSSSFEDISSVTDEEYVVLHGEHRWVAIKRELEENRTHHFEHLFISLCTGGLWATVWIYVAVSNAKKRNTIRNDNGWLTEPNPIIFIIPIVVLLSVFMVVWSGSS
jgi:hypothetical protein